MSKVARLIDDWDLDGVDEKLEAYWLGTGDQEYSLRDLADWFNQQVLAAAIEEHGGSYVDGEIENTYRLLTSDETSSGVRVEVETRLEQRGIDVEELRRSFVSHQSMHTYLTEYRGVSKPSTTSDKTQIEKTNEAIQRLVTRTEAVVRNNIDNLRNTDRISVGKFNVFVDVQIFCQECNTQFGVDDLITQGGCECE